MSAPKQNILVTAGKIKVNSTSKIKKMTAIRKNWIENGSRAELIGSNPHSNGDGFSRSENSFLDKEKLITIRANEIVRITTVTKII
jgi:hypothetical protein